MEAPSAVGNRNEATMTENQNSLDFPRISSKPNGCGSSLSFPRFSSHVEPCHVSLRSNFRKTTRLCLFFIGLKTKTHDGHWGERVKGYMPGTITLSYWYRLLNNTSLPTPFACGLGILSKGLCRQVEPCADNSWIIRLRSASEPHPENSELHPTLNPRIHFIL